MEREERCSTRAESGRCVGKAVGYLRRWSDQEPDRTLIEALKAEGCARIFEDVLDDQDSPLTALDAAIGAVKAGDVLVTPSLDERITQLADRNVNLRSIRENIVLRTQEPCSFRAAVSTLRRFEYNIVSDRVRRSLVKAAANGRRGGRRRALTDDKLLKVKRMLDEPGLTVSEIAEAVGVSAATIYRHIPSPRGQGRRR